MSTGEAQFSPEQRRRIVALVEAVPWGDMDPNIRDLEEALERALDATAPDFPLWEEHAEECGYIDEFSVTPEQLREMSPEWRFAYVARLVRTVAISYGVSAPEYSYKPPMLQESPATPASLLRGINDIAFLPTLPGSHD